MTTRAGQSLVDGLAKHVAGAAKHAADSAPKLPTRPAIPVPPAIPAAALAVGAGGALLAGGVLMAPVLGVIGFSSIGPVAGSMAAGIQSAGAAGAVFSTLQSAAMGGYGVAAVAPVFAGVGAAVGAAVGAGAAAVATGRKEGGKEGGDGEREEGEMEEGRMDERKALVEEGGVDKTQGRDEGSAKSKRWFGV